jgi:general secretion pathway protein I
MRTTHSKKYSHGFSLLEVLVAFSIAAVSLGVLFQIYAKGTTAAILGEEYAQAIAIAESKLAALSVNEDLGSPEEQGRENDKYEWEVRVEDHIDDAPTDFSPKILLKEVSVTVIWKSAGKTRSFDLQSLKPRPAI